MTHARRLPKALTYAFLYLVLLVMIVPFLWLILSSFRPNAELFSDPFAIPRSLSLDNYSAVLSSHPMFLYLFNTVAVTALATALDVTVGVMAGYGLMHHFRGKGATSFLLTLGLFIPTNAFLVPYYIMVNGVDLYDSLWGIALIYAGINLPITVMVVRGYMSTLPSELMESAHIDGATSVQTMIRIILPVSIPGIVTSCVFVVIQCWNELLFANILNQNDVSRTLQVAIRSFLTTFEANYAYAFAAMVLAILPTILIYSLLTNQIISGMTAGAIKG
ncbi:MAG: carbohydrate ABC transporter permease [Eubacteriales bacterium]|nr:carbohydrate ABC transporter permease [Eubacteriales bacterium]